MVLTDLDSDDPIQDLSRALCQWTLFAGILGLLQTIAGREPVCPRMTVNTCNHFRRNRFSKKPFFEEIVFGDQEECR